MQSEGLLVEEVSEVDFLNMKDEWNDLVNHSCVCPLFMGWSWMASWWITWSRNLDLELFIIAVRKDGVLVGLAPFYVKKKAGLLKGGKSIHVLGNAWKISPTVRTEYTDIIASPDLREQVLDLVSHQIEKMKWDMFVICDNVSNKFEWYKNSRLKSDVRDYLIKKDIGVVLSVNHDFDQWKASLSTSFRLKAFNRRQYLSKKVTLEFVQAQSNEFDFYFDELNRLHETRWGEPCFEKLSLEFHKRFISLLGSNQKIRFSGLKLNGQFESILYDVEAGDKIYNLQAGFNENYDKKVSLGSLHLGYAVEHAFKDPKIKQYDLLAGGGKKTYYKQHFKGGVVEFFTVILVRNPMLKLVYSTKQRVVALLRKSS